MANDSDQGFDTALAGTPERVWAEHLSRERTWSPPDGPLIVVSPHPDDEVLAAGGLIHSWLGLGRAVTIVSVTDGEAAYACGGDLAAVRRAELHAALRKLSAAPLSVVRLGLPDGQVTQHRAQLRTGIEALLLPLAVLVAPYQHDGHPDHEATGDVCAALAQAHGTTLVRYPVWAWHRLTPADLPQTRWGKFVLDSAAQRAKAHAVQCFTSQLAPVDHPPVVPAHVLTYFQRPYEAFIL